MSAMKVVIIGNGAAGFTAASTLRQLDAKCEMIIISMEKNPLYSPSALPSYIAAHINRERLFIKSKRDYIRLGIHPLFGHVVNEIDVTEKKIITHKGKPIFFDKLIIATGSEARTFGEPKKGIFKLKTLKDAEEIRKHRGKRAFVVGAGAIGIEIGIALLNREYNVTIVEMMDQVFPMSFDKKGACKIQEIIEERGIKVILGKRVESVLGNDRVEALATDKRELACDTLIWALGIRPRVELAKKAGIEIGPKGGIKVNSHMATSILDVYACGDCVESHEILTGEPMLNLFWHNAVRQGTVAARNCAGLTTDYLGSQILLSADIFANHVVGIGFTEATLNQLRNSGTLTGKRPEISVIEKENKGSYYRLVIVEDRCMGGQFINVNQGVGLLLSVILQGRSVEELSAIFNFEGPIWSRLWWHRIKPFFQRQAILERKWDVG